MPHLRNNRSQNNELFIRRPTIDIANTQEAGDKWFDESGGKRE
jgi:hypothetical protein